MKVGGPQQINIYIMRQTVWLHKSMHCTGHIVSP